MRLHYIINPAAGAGKSLKQWNKLESQLKSSGIDYAFTFTKRVGDATEIAKNIAGETDLLIAVGGDGTVHEVANGLLSSENNSTALCVLPVGTGNDFAAAWKMPGSISQHLQLLKSHLAKESHEGVLRTFGQTVYQDGLLIEHVETLERKYCISMSGIGLDSEVVKNINAYRKIKRGGKMIYLLAALKAVRRFKPISIDVTLTAEHELLIQQSDNNTNNVITIAFGMHKTNGGGLMQCPDADPADGLVDVTIVQSLNTFQVLQVAIALFSGRLLKHSRVKTFSVKTISLKRLCDWQLEADGELLSTPPYRLTVKENALKLFVPKS